MPSVGPPTAVPANSTILPTDPAVAPAGRYVGLAIQDGKPSSQQNKFWVTRMYFDGGTAKIEYMFEEGPVECSGTLTRTSISGATSVWQERIADGRCDDNGTWRLTLHDSDVLQGVYDPPSRRYVVSAELKRNF